MRTTTPAELLDDVLGEGVGDALGRAATSWTDAVERWWGPPPQQPERRRGDDRDGRRRRCLDGCGCGDPCACCVPRADIVVHARAGEQRVIAFALRNPRHREREVTLEVGPWHACGGQDVAVRADWELPSPLVLGSCERRVVRLTLAVEAGARDQQQRRDVEACAGVYADVRFEGCARPQRMAVIVHPTACDAIEITCACGCC